MPSMNLLQQWNEDPEFLKLPDDEKRSIVSNFFDSEVTEDFFDLPETERKAIKKQFFS